MKLQAAVLGLVLSASAGHIVAQQGPTGDAAVAPSALRYRVNWTNVMGASVAGDGDQRARLGGRLDGFLSVDGKHLWLWDGLTVNAHAEVVYGRTTGRGAGTLLPIHVATTLPSANEEDVELSLNVSQRLGSATLTFGKIDMLDVLSRTPLVGGNGTERFMNLGLAAPPTVLTPPSIFGALLSIPSSRASFTIGVWDPTSALHRTGLEHPFDAGVVGMVGATVPVTLRGKRGFQGLSVMASSKRGLDLEDIPQLGLPAESEVVLREKKGSWHVKYNFQQYLWQDSTDASRGWGVFGQLGFWDANPTPLKWSMTLGASGSVPLATRPRDQFGVGYFRTSLSNTLKNGLLPLVALQTEQGVEVFYSARVFGRLDLTADVQFIDPVSAAADNAVFFGLRAGIRLW